MIQKQITDQEMTPNRTTTQRTPRGCYVNAVDNWYGNYHGSELSYLWGAVRNVVKMAKKYRLVHCTEAHWMAVVVHPLLSLVRQLHKYQAEDFERIEVADM